MAEETWDYLGEKWEHIADPSTKIRFKCVRSEPAKDKTSPDEDKVPLNDLVRKKGIKKGNNKDNNLCYICRCDFGLYHHAADWICCITCKNWVCGVCNKDSTNPAYESVVCEDTD